MHRLMTTASSDNFYCSELRYSAQDMTPFDHLTSDFYSPIENPRILTNGLIEERVRVDRKLYEQLLGLERFAGSSGGLPFASSPEAEEFFQSVMMTTQTEITWPSRLKLNTRSRKDPHIRIVGTMAGVNEAKNIVNSLLDTRMNRVTVKMDVAFTDHSHVIGKGGRSIQKVMDTTGCHIHFPDSNRSNSLEKSNQVSIAGTAQGAEQARCRVRELLPVSVHYEIPMGIIVHAAMEPGSVTLQSLQREYGLNITFKSLTSFSGGMYFRNPTAGVTAIRVTIRGSRALAAALRQGISHLLEYLTAGVLELSKTPALIETEIAAQHHAFVMGRGNCNIRNIHQATGAMVSFPEATSPFLGLVAPTASSLPNKRSNVKIAGSNFDCAYNGWIELMGYLPLLLIFDLPDGRDCDAGQVTQMMDTLKVSILIKPKQKQCAKSVMVRGPERESRTLFEVRRQILELDQSEVPFCCEQHYWATHYSSMTPAATAGTSVRPSMALPPITAPNSLQCSFAAPGPRPLLDSNSSVVESRVRPYDETSLSSMVAQLRASSDRRRVRRLDTYDSIPVGNEDDVRAICRSFADNFSVSTPTETCVADDVFARSLPQDQLRQQLPFMPDVASGAEGEEATGHTDFSSVLSHTFPFHSLRHENGRKTDVEKDCAIA